MLYINFCEFNGKYYHAICLHTCLTNYYYFLCRAEKSIDANKFIGICMPGEGSIPKKLADGIGKGVLDNKERLIVESSG